MSRPASRHAAPDAAMVEVLGMKWPWVSRGRFDLLQHNFDEARKKFHEADAAWVKIFDEQRERYLGYERQAQALTAEAIALCKERDKRYDALLEKYHALANPQVSRQPMTPQSRKPADEAIETVVSRFGGSSRLRRELQRYVLRERSMDGADESRIAESILNWRDPEPDEDVA